MKPTPKQPLLDFQKALKTLNINKIWYPFLVGIGITALLLFRKGKISDDTTLLLSKPNWKYLLMMIMTVVLREFGQMLRIRIFTNKILSWKSSFYITILWEFASAVTPSVVGGGIVAIFLFFKEGMKLGRALSYVLLAGILDNLFFVVTASRGFWGHYEFIFTALGDWGNSIKVIFWTNYTLLTCYTMIIAFGIFINPTLLKWILMKITSVSFLKKFRRTAYTLSKDIIIASNEFQQKRYPFWIKIIVCTFCTWMMRYSFLNCLIASYVPLHIADHLAIFSKQVINWAIMLIPLAPGGSGIAEVLFQELYGSSLGERTLILDIAWRMLTFYLYLTLGAIFLPKWLKKVLSNKQINQDKILS